MIINLTIQDCLDCLLSDRSHCIGLELGPRHLELINVHQSNCSAKIVFFVSHVGGPLSLATFSSTSCASERMVRLIEFGLYVYARAVLFTTVPHIHFQPIVSPIRTLPGINFSVI
jgi:hypothetical protein